MRSVLCILAAALFASTCFAEDVATPVPTATPRPHRSKLSRVCPTIKLLKSPVVYGYEATRHISGLDKAASCALTFSVTGKAYWPRQRLVPLYDEKGKVLSNFIMFSQFGEVYAARFYTPYNPICVQIAAMAKKRTGKTTGYVKVSKNVCWKINSLYQRQGAGWRIINGVRVPLDAD